MTNLLVDSALVAMAEAGLTALGAYLAIGAVFALAFAVRGVSAVDPAGPGMPLTARLLVLPGAAALWPLLLSRWWRRQAPPRA
jgi:hypothetical protein